MGFRLPFDNRSTAVTLAMLILAACAGRTTTDSNATASPGIGGESGAAGAVTGPAGVSTGSGGQPGTAVGGGQGGYSGSPPTGPLCSPPLDGNSPPPADLCGAPLTYALKIARSMALPLQDGTGIACDGDLLWLMFRVGDADAALVQFDPATASVLQRFDYPGFVEQAPNGLGSHLGGIAKVGDGLWVAIGGEIHRLVLVNATTGQIVRTMVSPPAYVAADLDFDSQENLLYLSSGYGQLHKVNPASGGIVASWPIADFQLSSDTGSALRPGELWVARKFSPAIFVHEAGAGAMIGWVSGVPKIQDALKSPMCFAKDQLVTLTDLGITYYQITPVK